MGFTCEDFLGYSLKRASLVFSGEFNRTLADLGLRPVVFTLLLLIGDRPGITSSQLGQVLDVQSSNMVGLIREIKRQGWVQVVSRTEDRRAKGLHLTDEGQLFLRQAQTLAMQADRKACERLSPTQRQMLSELLRLIYT